MKYILSADLGVEQDFTAFSVLETVIIEHREKGMQDMRLGLPGRRIFDTMAYLRYLERPPLGTPYETVIERAKSLLSTPPLSGNTSFLVDYTGVGHPVVEWMRREGLRPVPILITGGRTVTEEQNGGYGVPKRDLAMALQTLYGSRRIKMAPRLGITRDGKGEDLTQVLLQELGNFKVKKTEKNNVTYEAWREGDHDDMVLSVAMAAWFFCRENPFRKVYDDEPHEKPYNPRDYL